MKIQFWTRSQAVNTGKCLEAMGHTVIRRPEPVSGMDLIVNWGYRTSPRSALNHNAPCANKLVELRLLEHGGVLTPGFQVAYHAGWYPRTLHHMGSTDFAPPITRGDYYTEPIDLIREFRVHSFLGHTIAVGEKVHMDDFTGRRHPRIRAERTGWELNYGSRRGPIPPGLSTIGAAAVRAVSYDFGAVDVGITADGRIYTLEINSAPGVGVTLAPHYAEAIIREARRRV